MTTLRAAMERYGDRPFLLTVGEDGPHTSHTRVTLGGNGLTCALSKSAARNVRVRPSVSFLWPAIEAGGYAIIVNGTVRQVAQGAPEPVASIELTKAVFHRPGEPQPGRESTCTSDCRPIALR